MLEIGRPASVTDTPAVPFRLKLDSEVVLVTAITGSAAAPKLAVQRGYENTAAAAHSANTILRMVITPGMLIALQHRHEPQPVPPPRPLPQPMPGRTPGERQFLATNYS